MPTSDTNNTTIDSVDGATVSMSTSIITNNLTTTSDPPYTTNDITYIIIGAVIGAAVAIIIIATFILCVVISMKKYYKRKSSIDLCTPDSEKSPNCDGYVNALYDSKYSPQILNTSHIHQEEV